MRAAIILLSGLVAVSACGSSRNGLPVNPMSPSVFPAQGTYASNGERIYFTSFSASGTSISYTGGPASISPMMKLSCVNCHGAGGHGGRVNMFGQSFVAADISWTALSGPDMDHAPYTESTLKTAITQGIDPAGHSLDSTMPRWSMSGQDLNDLVHYIEVLK